MSSLIYPASLPGLTWNSTRTPQFNTGVQSALSKKESRIAYQLYPSFAFELQYELLRDYVTPSDVKALVGLFMACKGKFDTFLYSDPVFNGVTAFQFGTGDGVTAAFQLTAAYQNVGGPGLAELVQNLNGEPLIYVNGVLSYGYTLGPTGQVSFSSIPPLAAAISWTGNFFYRCRFDDDSFTVTQFLSNFWEQKKVTLQSIKL